MAQTTQKSFFAKIGDKILQVVEYPFKHAAQIASILSKGLNAAEVAVADEPEVKTLIVQLVENFEKLGPDVLSDIASKGLDIEADAQTVEDVKAAFAYFTGSFLPAIEKIYEGLFQPASDPAPATSASPAPAPAAAGSVTVQH